MKKKFLAFELHFNFGKKREREGRSKMQKMWENFFGMFLQIHLLLLFLQKYEGGWLPARRSSLKLLFKQKQLEFQNTVKLRSRLVSCDMAVFKL